MSEARTFRDFDSLCLEARKHFRSHSLQTRTEVGDIFNLCLDLFRSIGKFKEPEEWGGSREEYVLSVLIQTVETVLAMFYLSESGFWDSSLVLKRNIAELMLTAIAIGYDKQCFIDWQHSRDSFDEFNKIMGRVESSPNIPEIEKLFVPRLKKYWVESSQLYSHNISRKSIRTVPKKGYFELEPKVAQIEFQEKRMHTIRNMLTDIISISLGIFEYGTFAERNRSQFPEAPKIIARCNWCMQNEVWKTQETA